MLTNLQNFSPKILVIGDLMIDNYLWGSCNRISPEAPVQVIDIKSQTSVLGGAGNVLNNLKSLGAEVSIMSVIGGCEISDELKVLLEEINIDLGFLVTQKNRITSKKTRIISSQQQVVRYDVESSDSISKLTESKLTELLETNITRFDLIIISDYDKGLLTNSFTQTVIRTATKNNIKVIVDPKGNDYSKYQGAFLLTPNRKEASLATGISIDNQSSLKKALKKLKELCKLEISLITLSDDGIAFLDKKFHLRPTVAKEVYDVTGAGDTVIACLGYSLATKTNINIAVEFANLAAGVVVGKIGSATATFEEIHEYESSLKISGCDENIKNTKEIVKIISNLRKKNISIVFTNGCFDILHLGHIKYLEKARELGDILIVGINSDESIKRIKGDQRPVNSLYDRACLIASLKSVDYVVPFEEDNPEMLIKKIMPDILAKGADYKVEEVIGGKFAKKVVLIDFIDGKSTTKLISKIKESK
jgi:D-beta-D-heptose 7-phosphate kinase/D-beta-D-heptose 1-phosphate adenosyltransferase